MKTDESTEPVTVFLQNLPRAVSKLKNRLQRDYEQAYPGLGDLVRIVLDEEEARAWELSFPLLFLPDLVEAHIAQLGLEPVMWNVTGYDWNAPSADYIEKRVTGKIRGGNVVLLHDGGHAAFGADRSNTVEAVDRLLTRYKSEGFEFVTIPQMRSRNPLSSRTRPPREGGRGT